jgi:hypothetical protein
LTEAKHPPVTQYPEHAAEPARRAELIKEKIMRIRKPITAAAALAALGITGALLAPAAASAHSATKTLTFTSVANNFVRYSTATLAEQDTDLSAAGKIIGFDEATVTLGTTTNTADFAFDLNGGLLYGTLTINRSAGTASGSVTGGTGSFSGATGTITATPVTKKKEAITITYSS